MCVQLPMIKHFGNYFSRLTDAWEPLSRVIPISKNKLTPYRAVIIMRLIVLGLFFHYRITNPVDSAYGLWLTSIICEIWFAFSWVLDQFPKWCPINRETYIDRLAARYLLLSMLYQQYSFLLVFRVAIISSEKGSFIMT